MSIVDRVKNILLTPNTEWRVIDAEPSSTGTLIGGYAAPLIGVSAIAGFIGGSIVGTSMLFVSGTYRVPIFAGLVGACLMVVLGLVGLFVLAFIINALAPTFGGQQNFTQALKVAVYSYTPGWVAGVLNIIPMLGVLAIIAGLYGIYLLYLGLPVVMKSPPDKAVGYTVVVLICAIVVSIVTSGLALAVAGIGAMSSGALSGALGGSDTPAASEIQFDKNSPLGRLQELGKSMEQSNKQLEEAQKSGDPNAAAAAALSTLGTLMGGGRNVDPLELDQLKTFVPASFAGLQREGSGSVEKSGIGTLMVSKAQAYYTDGGDKRVRLEIVDSGGASGWMGLASWATLQSSREDDNGYEKTGKVNGRMVHEQHSKNGSDEYSIVLGERFMVTASSDDLEVDALKAAVSSLDLGRLESLKEAGVRP